MIKKLLIFGLIALSPLAVHAKNLDGKTYQFDKQFVLAEDALAATNTEAMVAIVGAIRDANRTGDYSNLGPLEDFGKQIGTLQTIAAGETVILHYLKIVPKMQMPTSLGTVTYQGKDYMMLIFDYTFRK